MGLSSAAGVLYSSYSEENKKKKKYMWARRSAECRATISEDCFCIHEAFGEPQITDYLDAVTPGDVYLFTTKGPSLKSHSRRNRLNAGPGETEGRALKRRWDKNRGCVETVASTSVILLNVSSSQLKLHIKEDITKSFPVSDISQKTEEVETGEMTPLSVVR